MMEETTSEMGIYKSFTSVDIAQLMLELLKDSDTTYELTDSNGPIEHIDPTQRYDKIEVWIAKDQFQAIDLLIEDKANSELDSIDKDYFIFEFSNDELRDVLINASEWSPLDLALANKLLKDRGDPFDKDELEKRREEKIAESASAREITQGRKNLGLIIAILLPVIGIITALIYLLSSKDDLSSKKVPKYGPCTKKHGKIILITALASAVLQTLTIFLL